MTILSSRTRYVLDHPWRFVAKVIAGFRANQGFLLAGAVAYYTLLSIIPMFALILVLLSQFMETSALLTAMDEYLLLVAPGQAEALVAQVKRSWGFLFLFQYWPTYSQCMTWSITRWIHPRTVAACPPQLTTC